MKHAVFFLATMAAICEITQHHATHIEFAPYCMSKCSAAVFYDYIVKLCLTIAYQKMVIRFRGYFSKYMTAGLQPHTILTTVYLLTLLKFESVLYVYNTLKAPARSLKFTGVC